ncbi:MAG: protein kinase [Acidobacteriota bacterium]|nr:protein kinase [Acidobacteriota bacterium]
MTNERADNLESGKSLAHYRILKKLGAGGLGEVYLAEDAKLGRKIALKILPAHALQNADNLRRFEQEARAASALNHPNIAHIYEIGDAEGVNFIAMEFVEGESLHDKIGSRARSSLPTINKTASFAANGRATASKWQSCAVNQRMTW